MEVIRYVLLCCLFSCLISPSQVRAEVFDESSQDEIREILGNKEFQPRSLKKSTIDSWKNRIWSTVLKETIEVWDAFEGVLKSIQKAGKSIPGADFIRSIFSIIADILKAIFTIIAALWQPLAWLCLLLALGGAVYFVAPYLSSLQSEQEQESDAQALLVTAPLTREQLSDFLSNTSYLKALCHLRDLLRLELLTKHKYNPSYTDREIAKKLPEDERIKALFKETSDIFEQAVYAGKHQSIERIEEFFSKYRSVIFR